MKSIPEKDAYCRRRGRPRRTQVLEGNPPPRCYTPQCYPDDEMEIISIPPEQMAVLNLIDLQGLSQEEAASALGISRKTVWQDIHEVRHRIVDALLHGKNIRVSNCDRRFHGLCPLRNLKICRRYGGVVCPRMTDQVCSDCEEYRSEPK